ncbi:MAG TPA: sporulation integral membrane protein YtvI, partial [Bacillales bacterium]|nr:sporulation integral membrane protein YtvI [Bacillales bacterium]
MNLNYLYIALRFLFVLMIVVVGLFVFYYVAQLTIPFIIAIIIAFFMNPLVNLLNRKLKVPRGLSVLISLIVIFGIIAGILTLLVIEMISGFTYLTNVVPEKANWFINYFEHFLTHQVKPLYNQILHSFHELSPNRQQTIMNNVQSIGQHVAQVLTNIGTGIVSFLTGFITALPNLFFIMGFALLGTFFISKDWYKFGDKIKTIMPDKVSSNVSHVFLGLKKAMFGFIRAQLTLISMTAALDLIGLLILRVDYAFTIAILTGIVDLLPYMGTGVVFVPWILYLFFTGNYSLTIGLSILYAVVLIQRQIMEPKIISSSIGLDPLATLVALFVGIQLFGFLGLIIGPVALVIINTLKEAGVFHDV